MERQPTLQEQVESWIALIGRVVFAVVGIWVIVKQQQLPDAERNVWQQMLGGAMCGPFVVPWLVSILVAARSGGQS
jgi:hypothetical protein